MSSSTENVKLGVCTVTFDGVDLGLTKGGVEVEVSTMTHEVTVDQFGETPVGEIITGRMVTANVPLAETTLDNLVKIMPGATLLTEGTGPATKKRVIVPVSTSLNLLTVAKKLVLRPYNTTGEDDFVIPLAMCPGAMNFTYQLDQERIFTARFKGYVGSNGMLFSVGDESVVIPNS